MPLSEQRVEVAAVIQVVGPLTVPPTLEMDMRVGEPRINRPPPDVDHARA